MNINELWDKLDSASCTGLPIRKALPILEEALLEAYKAGMTRAAHVCALEHVGRHRPGETPEHTWSYTANLEKLILKAREDTKTYAPIS